MMSAIKIAHVYWPATRQQLVIYADWQRFLHPQLAAMARLRHDLANHGHFICLSLRQQGDRSALALSHECGRGRPLGHFTTPACWQLAASRYC